MRALFDTNIIIDYLNGYTKARDEIQLYNARYVSIITYIEILVGVPDQDEYKMVEEFLTSFEIIHLDIEVARTAIEMRKRYKIKVPDSIILSSAQTHNALLITRDAKDFYQNIPIVRVPYTI